MLFFSLYGQSLSSKPAVFYTTTTIDLKENLRNNDVVSPLAKKVPNELNNRSELIRF